MVFILNAVAAINLDCGNAICTIFNLDALGIEILSVRDSTAIGSYMRSASTCAGMDEGINVLKEEEHHNLPCLNILLLL